MRLNTKYVCCWPFIGGTSPRLKFMSGDVVMYLGKAENGSVVRFNGSEYILQESDLSYFAPLNDLSEEE